jgi:beta-phosphoglucomutase-like phosphatase (HAD superfamily)
MALQKSGVEPYEAMVIENAPLGVRSAVAAGIFTIGVNTGILKPEEILREGAAVVFPNMKAVIKALC